ncbi:MAG: hypothetical protein ACYC2R_13980 [Burkholderiales bacterium]
MALVVYVLGDCPGCGAKDSFGNVEVFKTYVYRGCKRCRYNEQVPLPAVKKKVLYLDQFFFSHAFRVGDERFLDAADRIARLTALQLLAVPYSSIHEDETHQWKKRDELFKFIKDTARGEEFEPAYDVEQTQLVKAFRVWLEGGPAEYQLHRHDAIKDDLDSWDSYLRIEVGRYRGDVELIRDLKRQSIEGLVSLFDDWGKLTTSFEDDLAAEYAVAGKSYMDFYLEYMARIAVGDYEAMLDAPIASTIVETMLTVMPKEVPADQWLLKCTQFLVSDHFKATPYHWINAHMLATLKAMVKDGAYNNRERALSRLSGFFYDVKHVATYAPYVDAFVMDQPMAELVSKQTVRVGQRYGVKVLSLNNWNDLFAWLDGIEAAGMTEDHKKGLAVAYPV